MSRSESVYFRGKQIGRIRIDDWGVVFDPVDDRSEFAQLTVMTWEAVAAARSEINRTLQGRGHD